MADEEVVEEGGVATRSQMWKHEAMVEWLESEKGYELVGASPAEVIAAAFAHRVEWRKSDTYQDLVTQHAEAAEAAREERRQARELAAEQRAQERAAAKAEKEAASKSKTEGKATAKATKATKTTKKTTRKAAAPAEDPFG